MCDEVGVARRDDLAGRLARVRRFVAVSAGGVGAPHAASNNRGSKLAYGSSCHAPAWPMLFIVRELFRIERFANRFADVGHHQQHEPS